MKKISAAAILIFCVFGLRGCGGSSSGTSIPPPPPVPKYTVSGTVSGLPAGGSITLEFQGGSAACTAAPIVDSMTVASNGPFISNAVFPTGACCQVTAAKHREPAVHS